MKSIKLELASQKSPVIDKIVEVFQRQVHDRCGVQVSTCSEGNLTVVFEIRPDIGQEGFKIEDGSNGKIRIIGNDERGLLYGVGKFLRTSRYNNGGFTPGKWRGTSIPDKKVRMLYFATHFHNFYHDAPIKEIERYIEDLALWGYNALKVWFDMHHYTGINDPEAQEMINRLHAILKAANNIGLGAAIGGLSNEAYANSPEDLRAEPTGRPMYNVELCPNKPGAKELMLKWREELYSAFSDIELDYISVGPYDQGGCGCLKCKPWGANGYLVMAEAISHLAHKYFPKAKFILATWLFDYPKPQGEWEGLAKAFAKRPDWVDYILADSHTDFPEHPLKNGVPGGLPLLNFPEISMWNMCPWGGFGANPLPNRFQRLWDTVGSKISGGLPYSEGIFEDINKAIISQFYWKQDKNAEETVKEYIAFEYSYDVVNDVFSAIGILEKNHKLFCALKKEGVFHAIEMLEKNHKALKTEGEGAYYVRKKDDAGSNEAYEYMKRVDAQLLPYARNSWRWRILFLRSLLDRELFKNHGVPTKYGEEVFYGLPNDKCEEAYRELTKIYHAENAEFICAPPTIEAIKARRDWKNPAMAHR